MATNKRPSQAKRNREAAQKDKRRQKDADKAQRRSERDSAPAGTGDEDPDIAGIVPGPQPIPE